VENDQASGARDSQRKTRLRPFGRTDASLALSLAASTLIILDRPLHGLLDGLRDFEDQRDVALLPGLIFLFGSVAFLQYRRRRQEHAAATAAIASMETAVARTTELERLVAFGRALGTTLEPAATRQAFWRYMPTFAADRELWMLTRRHEGWEALIHDATARSERTSESIEAIASAALSTMAERSAHGDGVIVETDWCVPLVVGDSAVGVLGVRNIPEISLAERRAISAAAALLAIAVRNGQLLAQSRESSIRDSLTGCFNRAYATEALAAELRRAKRTFRPVSALMFDVDEFKEINDRHGHLIGDAILATIGARLSTMLRGTDIKCRYGGDEFLVILPDTSLHGAEHVAAALVDAVAKLRIDAGDSTVSPTVSIGVTLAAKGETDALAVVARADEALYWAKRGGRNQYVATSTTAAI
jgi:diguanylate cyclase (GGDEF)-like protein